MAQETLLIEHAEVLVTMDHARREIADGAAYVSGNVIERVGSSADLQAWIAADVARAPKRRI